MKKVFYILLIGVFSILTTTCSKRPLPDVFQSPNSPVDPTPQVSLPEVITGSVIEITFSTARVNCEVISDGGEDLIERGVCWSISQTPLINGDHITNGNSVGSYTINLTGLTAGQTYYVRAYAKNSAGVAYGETVSFLTDTRVPRVTTTEVYGITNNSAIVGGNVTYDGGYTVTTRGVCWSATNPVPTVASNHTICGAGLGSFTITITGLSPNTHYYVRAYATNSIGTGYGETVSFTTTE